MSMSAPSFFNFDQSGQDVVNNLIFRFDKSKLENDKTYLIFTEGHDATFKVIDWLRDVTFLDHKNQYTLESKSIDGIEFHAFSFPSKFTEICKKTAKLFDLNCSHISQSAIRAQKHYIIPASTKILVIRPKHSSGEGRLTTDEKKSILAFGKSIAISQLD